MGKIPKCIEVENDGLIFSMPIWCESFPEVRAVPNINDGRRPRVTSCLKSLSETTNIAGNWVGTHGESSNLNLDD